MLVLLFSFQSEAILAQPLVIAMLALPILIQAFFNPALAYWPNRSKGWYERPFSRQPATHSAVLPERDTSTTGTSGTRASR